MLKLLALDAEDLQVISAHLQDAVLRVGDLAYLPAQKRFAGIVNRFDWLQTATGDKALGSKTSAASRQTKKQTGFRRARSALRFDRVLGSKTLDIDLRNKDAVLSLLAIQFEPKLERQKAQNLVDSTILTDDGSETRGAAEVAGKLEPEGLEPEGLGPEGHVTLTFAGGGAIRLDVECIEVELADLGAVWATKNRPDHT